MAKEVGVKIGKLFSQVCDVMIPEFGGRLIKILAIVNLDKPLLRVATMKLNGVICWVDFKYEKLADVCYYCEQVGHLDKMCHARGEDVRNKVLKEGQYGDWLKGVSGRSRIKLGEGRGSGKMRGQGVEEANGEMQVREENKVRKIKESNIQLGGEESIQLVWCLGMGMGSD